MMHEQKVFKILNFWFIDIWNNIDQIQRNGSCIELIYGCIWMGRIQLESFQNYMCVCTCLYISDITYICLLFNLYVFLYTCILCIYIYVCVHICVCCVYTHISTLIHFTHIYNVYVSIYLYIQWSQLLHYLVFSKKNKQKFNLK